MQFFRHATIEQKQPFFLKCLRSNVSLDNKTFPLDVNLFNEETKIIVSMMSWFLELDTYKYILDFLMSPLFGVSMTQSESQYLPTPCLKFDKFLAEIIHSRLVNFHNTRHFRFQSYLIRMFFFFNEENLQLPNFFLIDLE